LRWHDPSFVLFAVPDERKKRIGIVAGKKVGNAVRRSRAKRRLRGLFLVMMPRVKPGEYVLVAKPPLLEAPFSDLIRAFERAIRRLKLEA